VMSTLELRHRVSIKAATSPKSPRQRIGATATSTTADADLSRCAPSESAVVTEAYRRGALLPRSRSLLEKPIDVHRFHLVCILTVAARAPFHV
jgi:hypothetical protein